MDRDVIRKTLSRFCDFVEIPVDQYGRRWYVNIHELRKSFLLTFFWTFKFASLDAGRWVAGHKNPDHMLAYIEANTPGEEMIESEAEYAQQQLRLFNSESTITEMQNIEKLNESVCEHFNVQSVSEVKSEDLKDWLQYAISTGEYKIEVFGIERFVANEGYSEWPEVAFRIGGTV